MAVFGDENGAKFYYLPSATVQVGGANGVALNVQIQYQRQVQLIPTLTAEKHFNVGRASGTFTGTFIFDEGIAGSLSTACNLGACTFSMAGQCDSPSKNVQCNDCILQSVQIQGDGSNGYATIAITATFSTLTA